MLQKYEQSPGRIPVTVVTGFLGSGKTTLLNHILRVQQGLKVAVIVNEFGEVGVDGQLLVTDADEELIEFNNGCICCTVRGDLIRSLDSLARRGGLDAVIIETTGIADPVPVASTFFVSDTIRSRFFLDAFVTMVDCVNLESSLKDSHEAQEQVAFADILILNKCDFVDSAQIEYIEAIVRRINPIAKIHHSKHAEVAISKVLNVGLFNLEVKLEIEPDLLNDVAHEHDSEVGSFVLREELPVDVNLFMSWITTVLKETGGDVFRTKGILNARGFQERLVFQSVRMLTALSRGRRWDSDSDDSRMNELVVIGRNLDQQKFESSFRQTVARTCKETRPVPG